MLGKILGFFICFLALLLPFRLRILFTEALGWFIQFFYFAFYSTLNFILKELKKTDHNKEGPND